MHTKKTAFTTNILWVWKKDVLPNKDVVCLRQARLGGLYDDLYFPTLFLRVDVEILD